MSKFGDRIDAWLGKVWFDCGRITTAYDYDALSHRSIGNILIITKRCHLPKLVVTLRGEETLVEPWNRDSHYHSKQS